MERLLRWSRRRALALAALGLFAVFAPAALADGPIAPFAGYWYGTTSQDAGVVRDISVLIRPDPAGGFRIDWDNYTVVESASGQASVEFRENELVFRPGDQDGAWQADPPLGAAEGFRAEAVVDGNVLTVTVEVQDPAGRGERQVYQRTVVDDRMELFYQRLIDGAVARELGGSLTRVYEEGPATGQ